MPAVARIDMIEDLECEERNGVIRRLVRKMRITGVNVRRKEISGSEATTSYKILYAPLNIDQLITETGPGTVVSEGGATIPKINTRLDSDFGKMLVLVDRKARLVNQDKRTVDLYLTYHHMMDGPYQDLQWGVDDSGIIYGKLRTSLVHIKTNIGPLQFNDGTVIHDPITGEIIYGAITTTYVYPPGHPQAGVIETQGHEINVPEAQHTYTLHGYIDTNHPEELASALGGSLNKTLWLHGDPRTWLCTEVRFEIISSVSPHQQRKNKKRYEFYFEFQYSEDWDPGVIFIDHLTNAPPPDLRENIGYRTIPYLDEVEFRDYLAEPEVV